MTYLHDNTWRIAALKEMGFAHSMDRGEHVVVGWGLTLRHTSLLCLMGRIAHNLLAAGEAAAQKSDTPDPNQFLLPYEG